MYQTSTKWKENRYEDIENKLNIYIDGTLIDSDYILELKKGGEIFEEELTLGSVPAQYIEIKILKEGLLNKPSQIRVEYGLLIDEVFEIIPMGLYNIEDYIDNDDDTITIKALDNIIKFEFNYNGKELIDIKGKATLLEVAQDICSKAGVELRFYFFFEYE